MFIYPCLLCFQLGAGRLCLFNSVGILWITLTCHGELDVRLIA